MPTFQGLTQQGGVPNVARSMPVVRSAQSGDSPVFEYPYALSGVTRDANGNPLGNCIVKLFRTADDSLVHQTISDANGVYVIPASNVLQHYLVAYLPGAPDVEGTTVNTLTAT